MAAEQVKPQTSAAYAYDDFIDFCRAIHINEEDPELMVQDYEGFMSEDDFAHIPRIL